MPQSLCTVFMFKNSKYTFEGWYINPDLTGKPISLVKGIEIEVNTILYAKWSLKNTPEPTNPMLGEELGDVDNDGNINASDALLVLKHAAKISTLADNQKLVADTSKDGDINASDALLILKYAARIIDSFD